MHWPSPLPLALFLAHAVWGAPAPLETLDTLIARAAKNTGGVEVELDKEGPLVSVDMDMLFTRDEWDKLHNKNSTGGDGRHKRKATNDWSRRWTDKTIPYQIRDADFSSSEIDQIMGAMWEWSEYTCVRFKPATSSDWNKILIKDGHGCKSFVGMTGGRQYVMLAKTCRQRGLIIHELGHIIGFYHEHTRPDRDEHVTIVKENIPESMFFNFEKFGWDVIGDYGVPYDYLSIMHYGPTAFSMNGGYTILTKDPAYQTTIGNRNHLSFRDIKLANKMYGCSDHCGRSDSECPGEGFVGKDCQCLCPGSPIKVCEGSSWSKETTTSSSKNYGWDNHGDDTWGEGGTSWSEDDYDYDYDYENGDAPPIHSSSPNSRFGSDMIAICTDYHSKCPTWASGGFCTKKKFSSYMASTCKESCHMCAHDDSVHGWHYDVTEAASCRDGHPRCQELSARGKCLTPLYRPFMALYCRQACLLCQPKRQLLLPTEA